MKIARREEYNFLSLISAMDILQFHAFCAFLWDEEKSQPMKWNLWKGVRGYPGQDEVLEAFSTEKYPWLLKGRQLAGDESCSFVSFHKSLTIKKHETDFITKDYDDAKYFLKRRLLRQMEAAYALEYLPGRRFPWPKYVDNSDTGIIRWENDSFVEAFSSDDQGVRSRSPGLVVLNEIRTFSPKQAEELWMAIRGTVDTNPSRQCICLSTAAFGSWFNQMCKAIMDGDIDGVRFLFMPDDTDPKRTDAFRKEALRRVLVKANYIQEHPREPEDCFVGREGAVFRNFDPTPGGQHVRPVELNWAYTFCIGYDHGRTHPAVLLLCLYNRYTDHLYVFDEVFCRNMDLPEVAMAIMSKMTFYYRNHGAPKPSVRIADASCFNKTGQKTVAEAMRDLTGLTFSRSEKYDKMGSIDRLASRITNRLLIIDPRCTNTIRQIAELRYKKDPTESKREDTVDIEDDAVDVIRYLDAEVAPHMRRRPNKEPLEVLLDRKKRVQELARRGMSQGSDALEATSWLNL